MKQLTFIHITAWMNMEFLCILPITCCLCRQLRRSYGHSLHS